MAKSNPELKSVVPGNGSSGASIDDNDLKLHANRGAGAITARLRKAIESGVYGDGDQLPPERQLAEAFSTARSTVRRALERLEKKGLVVRRIGSGTFVKYTGPLKQPDADIAELVSPLQLIEARFAVEPYMTRLAAIHATRQELGEMEAALDRLEKCGGDENEFRGWDMEFHQRLARCSGNPLVLHLYRQINEVRSHAQWAAMKKQILNVNTINEYNRQHRALFEALCQHDVQAAVDIMNAHLEKARQDLIGAHSL